MNNGIYAIYDEKAKYYQAPFVVGNDEVAIRLLDTEMQNKNSMLAKHPNDFTLYRIGWFDDQAGSVTPCEPKDNLGKASNVRLAFDVEKVVPLESKN